MSYSTVAVAPYATAVPYAILFIEFCICFVVVALKLLIVP